MLRLYNTLTRRVEAFRPGDPAHVTFYSCGPTVYDDSHIGNFRSFLVADVLRRFIESPLCIVEGPTGEPARGPRRVTHVMNITDVGHMTDDAEGGEQGEDRMAVAGRRLLEAKKAGRLPPEVSIDPRDPYAIAAFYAERFLQDARRLGLKVALDADPSLMPRASAKVAGMIAVIERLIARGHAYAVGPSGRQTVYFHVPSIPGYGRLSGNTLDKLREGEGGRIAAADQAQKKHPADFLLWKSDPAHIMKWDSPWGAGYPGWHVECTVMAVERLFHRDGLDFAALLARPPEDNPLGDSALIDIHSGGEDNIFPHHECEIAQTCGAFNQPAGRGSFARLWFHGRHLLVEGQKMSKSKGNFFTARDLFARGVEPAALRLALISGHYRSNINFTIQGLADAARMVERWRRMWSPSPSAAEPDPSLIVPFAAAMHDDLNVAAAVAEVNRWCGAVESPGPAQVAAIRLVDDVLGVLSLDRPEAVRTEIGLFAPGVEPSAEVEALLVERRAARAAKDFARSDAIRDRLAEMGYAIKDVPGGRVEVARRAT